MRNLLRTGLLLSILANAHAADWTGYTNDWLCPIIARYQFCMAESMLETALGVDLPDLGCINGAATSADTSALTSPSNTTSVTYMFATTASVNAPENSCNAITTKTACDIPACEWGSTLDSGSDLCFMDHDRKAEAVKNDGAPTALQAFVAATNDRTCERIGTQSECAAVANSLCSWGEGSCDMSWTGYSNHYSVCQNIVDFLKPAVADEAPPPPPPPPGQFIDNAPDGTCCAAFYGVSNHENANACDKCHGMGNGFTCRDSHQQAGVDKTSKDCISFEYATEEACTATSKVWISPDWNGIGCSRNDTQFLAKSHAHSLSMLLALIIAVLCFSL